MKWFFRISTGAALLWLAGLVAFRVMMPLPGFLPPAEGIVVFTGDVGRIAQGLRLFQDLYAPRLLISGVDTHLRITDLKNISSEKQAFITLDATSRNTIQNVKATKAWAETYQLTTIIVVSGHYHFPRIRHLFHRFAPSLQLICAPVIAPEFQSSYWWIHPHAIHKMMREYHKFLVTLFLNSYWLGYRKCID